MATSFPHRKSLIGKKSWNTNYICFGFPFDALQDSADTQKASWRLSAFVFEVWEVKILTEKLSLGAWKTSLGTLLIASGVVETPLGARETPLGGKEIWLEQWKLRPTSGGRSRFSGRNSSNAGATSNPGEGSSRGSRQGGRWHLTTYHQFLLLQHITNFF